MYVLSVVLVIHMGLTAPWKLFLARVQTCLSPTVNVMIAKHHDHPLEKSLTIRIDHVPSDSPMLTCLKTDNSTVEVMFSIAFVEGTQSKGRGHLRLMLHILWKLWIYEGKRSFLARYVSSDSLV